MSCCAFLLSGCWFFSSKTPNVVPIEAKAYDDLPEEPDALFEFANSKNREDASISDLSTAIAAYEKLEKKIETSTSTASIELVEVQWRLAKAIFLAGEHANDASEKMRWIVKGEGVSDNIITTNPNRVEGYYYSALLKGRRAQNSGIGFGAMKLAKKVEELGLKASNIDPSFAEGGPLRLLAMLYAHAPPWPTSIGDMDLAIEYADRAVEISDYPMNHLIRAEVLIEDDELDEAQIELKKVLAAPKIGLWAREGEQWRPYAMKLLSQIENK